MGETKKFFAMGENTPSKINKKAIGSALKKSGDKLLKAIDENKKYTTIKSIDKLGLTPVAGTKNRVFVLPAFKEEKVSAGGILMEMEDKTKLQPYGTIIGISEVDESGVKAECKLGDVVYFGANFTTEEFNGVKYFLMREGNIYGKL